MIDPTECDHIVGFSTGVDESWLTRWSQSGKDKHYLDDLFAFCPECGVSLKGIKLKRYRRPKRDTSPFGLECERMEAEVMEKMLKSKNSFASLNFPGTFTVERSIKHD